MKYTSCSAEETKKIAAKLADRLKGGEILALRGELGAGKTTFCQGLAQALGVAETVNSPTFVIMKIYQAKHPIIKALVHIDAYRLGSGHDLTIIGAQDYLGQADTVCAIEWPEKVSDIIPAQAQEIFFTHSSGKVLINA